MFDMSTEKETFKVKLLNEGGYDGFDNVRFPVIAAAFRVAGSSMIYVSGAELIRVGIDPTTVDEDEAYCFFSFEVEVL